MRCACFRLARGACVAAVAGRFGCHALGVGSVMDVPDRLTIEDFCIGQGDELVRMWRASFEYGVGVTDPHPLTEQRGYFFSEVRPRNAVRVAMLEDCMVGFVAANRSR